MYSVGVDVGTGSVRAGLVDITNGKIISSHIENITTWNPKTAHYEQSSEEIWNATCKAVKKTLKLSNIPNIEDQIIGIGFDATCSLVAIDEFDNPISLSTTGNKNQNIILWMDHRAVQQTERINSCNFEVLKYVGGKVNVEMQTPKLLWIKENLPNVWKNQNVKYFDLADFLVYKSTGVSDTRSLCTTTCKWTYQPHQKGWDDEYFTKIGLGEIVQRGYSQIGKKVGRMGDAVGNGLTAKASKELGLKLHTPVSYGIIDAHAGGIGIIGSPINDIKPTDSELVKRLALICGTSSCHMAISKNPIFVPGVWGPFSETMLPGYWLNEGGQSATGKLIDHVISSHAYTPKLKEICKNGCEIEYLNQHLEKLSKEKKLPNIDYLTEKVHVLDYFHGNRSPIANPNLVGVVCGLTLSNNLDDLAVLYLATIQAIAYGTKHIIDEMNKYGHNIDRIFICGGLSKNLVFVQQIANITNCECVLSREEHVMIIGSAILGAVAGRAYNSLEEAMSKMSSVDKIIKPMNNKDIHSFHEKKFKVYREMYFDQVKYFKIMQ